MPPGLIVKNKGIKKALLFKRGFLYTELSLCALCVPFASFAGKKISRFQLVFVKKEQGNGRTEEQMNGGTEEQKNGIVEKKEVFSGN